MDIIKQARAALAEEAAEQARPLHTMVLALAGAGAAAASHAQVEAQSRALVKPPRPAQLERDRRELEFGLLQQVLDLIAVPASHEQGGSRLDEIVAQHYTHRPPADWPYIRLCLVLLTTSIDELSAGLEPKPARAAQDAFYDALEWLNEAHAKFDFETCCSILELHPRRTRAAIAGRFPLRLEARRPLEILYRWHV